MRRSLLNKITSYSALAGVVALAVPASDAEGQIIYTNVEPDVTLHISTYDIDLNGDGVADFQAENSMFTYGTYSGTGAYFYSKITPLGTNNELLGYKTWSGYEPLLLNDTISAAKPDWTNKTFYLYTTSGDAYLGLKSKAGSNVYYGWIRFKVATVYNEITIRDYAYNIQPGQLILAGQGACPGVQPPYITIDKDTLVAHAAAGLQWSRNGFALPAYTDSVKLYTPLQGTYVLSITDTSGCHLNSVPRAYWRCDSLYASIHRTDTITYDNCNNIHFNLAYSYNPAGLQFQWQNNGVDIKGATSSTYAGATTTTSDYQLVVSYNGCVKTSNIIHFNIYALPPPTVVQHQDSLVCLGKHLGYQWYHYNVPIAGETNWYYKSMFEKYMKVEVVDTIGCVLQSLYTKFDTCYRIVSSLVADDDSICYSNGDTWLHAYHMPGLHYIWSTGVTTDSFNYHVFTAGKYHVDIYDNKGCKKRVGPITVAGINNPSDEVSVHGDTLISMAGLVIYQWQLNNSDIPGATNRIYVVTQPGNYKVITTNSQGCSAASGVLTVSGMHSATGPEPYTLLQQGNMISISFDQTLQGGTVNIYNPLGQTVLTNPIHSGEENFTWRNAEGILIMVIRKDENYWVRKIVMP